MEEIRGPESCYDVVIVGGGPAGLTAGLYASRGGLKTLLLEGESSVSQITVTDLVENYPGFPEGVNGYDLVERFKAQARQFGVTVQADDVRAVSRGPGDSESTGGWIVTGKGRIRGWPSSWLREPTGAALECLEKRPLPGRACPIAPPVTVHFTGTGRLSSSAAEIPRSRRLSS